MRGAINTLTLGRSGSIRVPSVGMHRINVLCIGDDMSAKQCIAEVEYTGPLDPELDSALRDRGSHYGGKYLGSGYFFSTNTRDLTWLFKTQAAAGRFIKALRKVRWIHFRTRKKVYPA